MDKNATYELRKKHIGSSCALYFKEDPLKIVAARGQYMFDECKNQLLDCINNVAHVGHCHPDVVRAASDQMAILSTNSRFLHDNIGVLARKLADTLPGPLSVCFLVNSGTEATDLAVRLARAHTKAKDLVVLDHAYHGNSPTAIALSPYKFNGPGGEGKEDWVHVVPSPDTYNGLYTEQNSPGEDLGTKYAQEVRDTLAAASANGRKVAAFLAESMQSCAGQIVMPENFLRETYKFVREAGGVCIADEVQVGFGRVGRHWWAFQLGGEDIIPDIVTMGKPMGNGHPVSAVVTTPEIAASFQATGMEYFNTYGGNPVSCAVALAVMDVIEREKLMSNAVLIESHMRRRLQDVYDRHPLVGDVRGTGMFFGIELVRDRKTREPAPDATYAVVRRMKQRGILLSVDGPRDNVLKFKPPMCFTTENVDTLLANLHAVLMEVEDEFLNTKGATNVTFDRPGCDDTTLKVVASQEQLAAA